LQDFYEVIARTLERADARHGKVRRSEFCRLDTLHGRVLSQDIRADRPIPPFDRVAVDGYACRTDDLDDPLELIGTISAGEKPRYSVAPGTCVKVMTGAVLPKGAQMVVMVESTRLDEQGRVIFTGSDKERSSRNISFRGEDLAQGSLIFSGGTILGPRHSAVLASVGVAEVPVRSLPRVGILSTGDEVVEADRQPLAHQIRNANAPQLSAQLRDMGIEANYYGIARDDRDELTRLIARAQEENDLVLMSGGVSMGDFDFAPEAMAACGYQILYSRVAVKPGKPTTFAVSERGDLFGLPGNPVSCFVIFELLVKPYLYRLMGADFQPPIIKAAMATDFIRKKTRRIEWFPVRFEKDGTVMPVQYHGSGHFAAIAEADGVAPIAQGQAELKKGAQVDVRLFS